MTDQGESTGKVVLSSRPLGRWVKTVFLALVAVYAAMWGAEKHGIAVGAVIGLTYASMVVGQWIPALSLMRWSQEHPALDVLFFPFIVFSGLALFTPLSLLLCLAFAISGYMVLFGIGWIIRRYRVRDVG
ncbi:hypothetical protein [Nonomuraea turcica]|uniref:hypothetical protein n=1 Tax=Nonomuraea sp. G32 TaxID=3067274 RepID=UPI00273BCC52|nr:hypothetical protein [Nonomuraea sp. G32]MDP4507164.1 hypothetical protein [Nonomuraea sp. G32]